MISWGRGGWGQNNCLDRPQSALLCTIIKLYNEVGPISIKQLKDPKVSIEQLEPIAISQSLLLHKPYRYYHKLYKNLKELVALGFLHELKEDGFLYYVPTFSALYWFNSLGRKEFYSLNVPNFCTPLDLTDRGQPVRNFTSKLKLFPSTYDVKFALERNSKLRASKQWWSVRYLAYRFGIREEDLEKANDQFEDWLRDINTKVLVFMTPEGEPRYRFYQTRFNSLSKALEIEEAYEKAWKKAPEAVKKLEKLLKSSEEEIKALKNRIEEIKNEGETEKENERNLRILMRLKRLMIEKKSIEEKITDLKAQIEKLREEASPLLCLDKKKRRKLETEIRKKQKSLEKLKEALKRKIYRLRDFEVFGTGKGVYIVVTFPPPDIIPLRVQQILKSLIKHDLKALLRSRYGFSPPHIETPEPQKGERSRLSLHFNLIIFGIDFLDLRDFRKVKIAEENERERNRNAKEALTIWLDKRIEKYLSELGKAVKTRINHKLTPLEVKALNEFGRQILSRYREYKKSLQERGKRRRKKAVYTGPICWITRIHRRKGEWTFEHAPPNSIPRNTDGGSLSVFFYCKKYIGKNIRFVKARIKGEPLSDSETIVFYWLLRIPFFTCSPSLREKKTRLKLGWRFLRSLPLDLVPLLPALRI